MATRDPGISESKAPPQLYTDIEAAMGRGDAAAAQSLARQALDGGLRHPILFKLRARWHEDESRFAEACADLEQALALAPSNPALLTSLGRCALALGRFRAAANAFAAALAAGPEQASAHYQRGFALEQLGELDDAWTCYRRAAELDPQLDDAPARLAGLAARQGDGAQARALAAQALALNPRNVTAAFALIVADLADGRCAEAQARAFAVADDDAVVPQARAHALSFAADAADGQGRTAEAFALYTRANDALAALHRGRFEAPGRETGYPLALRLARDFAAQDPASWHRAAAPERHESGAAGLVFLVGFPRSGTTLLGQVLARHAAVVTIEEKPLLREALHAFIDRPGGLARLAALPADEIARHRAVFWRNVAAQGVAAGGKVVVDQTPLDTLHLPVLAKLFPDSKIVFAMRDPRDVVLSCFRRLFAVNGYLYEFLSLSGSARFYGAAMRLAELYRAPLGLPWLTVRNEDLIADFDSQAGALCGFLGLDFQDAMRDVSAAAKARRIATPSAMQLAQGLTADGVGHWKAYAGELAPIMPLVAPWVERFGYA